MRVGVILITNEGGPLIHLIPESFRPGATIINGWSLDTEVLVSLLNPILGLEPILRLVVLNTERLLGVRCDSESMSCGRVGIERS